MNISDINNEALDLVDADSGSYTGSAMVRRVNIAYEEIIGKLIALDTNWNFGDSNFTSLPTGLKTLVEDQTDYQIVGDSLTTGIDTTTPLLSLLGVSVKDAGGDWLPLKEITFNEIKDMGVDPAEFRDVSGLPEYYEKRGDFFVLYPAPDDGTSVTLANGLKVFFQRTADIFTDAEFTAGTKIPGFASPWHSLLSYKAAIPYAMKHLPDRVEFLMIEAAKLEAGLINFYTKRDKATRKGLNMAGITFK